MLPVQPVSLEGQLEALAELGLRLNDGVSVLDLLNTLHRETYEEEPYTELLWVFGIEIEEEPWGRYFSDDGWNFDLECIEGVGSYKNIIENLLRISKQPALITDIVDEIEFAPAGTGTIAYSLRSVRRVLPVQVDHDWADPAAIKTIMNDIAEAAGGGRTFWAADNGQASIVFFLTDDQAARINSLRPNVLTLMQERI